MTQLLGSARSAGRLALGVLLVATLTLAVACGGDDAGETDESGGSTTTPAAPRATQTAATAGATAASEATQAAAATQADPAAPRAVAVGDAGFDSGYPRFLDEEAGLTVILGTPDLGPGAQRLAFVVTDDQGLVRLPVLAVSAQFQGEDEPSLNSIARFYDFPEGIRGIYVTEMAFERAGQWTIGVSFPLPDGSSNGTTFPVQVAERTHAPNVGEAAPASSNRTLADVDSIHELSTGAEPDPLLYSQTIAEALEDGRPLVVVFASPGFCTNALCGPQAEVLSILRERYSEQANFIHVDLFENPDEIRTGGLDIAIETPLLMEWGLETAEWTFIIDANGIVVHRFEAFAAESELEPALLELIESS